MVEDRIVKLGVILGGKVYEGLAAIGILTAVGAIGVGVYEGGKIAYAKGMEVLSKKKEVQVQATTVEQVSGSML